MPVRALAAAERIARKRKVTLSVVVSEALEKNLRAEAAAKRDGERRVKAWEAYRQSFQRLSHKEQQALNGIFMDERTDK
jgi:hypothetical protein